MNNTTPIKVLTIVTQMNRGGLECRLMDILRTLNFNKVRIDIFTCRENKGTFDDEIISLGGSVYYNPPLTIFNMIWYIEYFRSFLASHPEYQIIHAHQDAWCSIFCMGAYFAKVPVRIAHSRTAIGKSSLQNFAKNVIRYPARKYATHYFAVSDLAGNWLFGKKNAKEGKVAIWKNAINCLNYRYDENKRKEMRELLKVGQSKVLIHVGNFTFPKNQIFLVEILKCLGKKIDAVLILVGKDGNHGLMQNMKVRVYNEGLKDKVQFLGERNDISDLLQAADVFCFPSLYEGLPGAVIEAQASGLPCIISDTVTKEACVLKTSYRLGLSEGAEAWSDLIMDCLKLKRKDTYLEMVNAGYDIHNLVRQLTEFYVNAGERNNAI